MTKRGDAALHSAILPEERLSWNLTMRRRTTRAECALTLRQPDTSGTIVGRSHDGRHRPNHRSRAARGVPKTFVFGTGLLICNDLAIATCAVAWIGLSGREHTILPHVPWFFTAARNLEILRFPSDPSRQQRDPCIRRGGLPRSICRRSIQGHQRARNAKGPVFSLQLAPPHSRRPPRLCGG